MIVCAATAYAAAGNDGATIRNSGSTNFSGYTIKVWSDGSAEASLSNRSGKALAAPVRKQIAPALAAKLLADAKAAKDSGHVVGEPCMKSASFGSTMVVQYHGWTSPDLECPGGGFVIALGSDANKIVAALHLQPEPAHRGLLPNEIRRPEPSAAQPSATPESQPPAP